MSNITGKGDILERILSLTDVLFAYLDTDFNFIWVNRAYAQADGREPEFYIGKNHFDLFPYKDNEKIFRRVVETGQAHTAMARDFEYAQNPERGVSYWDWTLHPVKDASGKVEALLLNLVNATERVRADMKYQESQSQLGAVIESLPFDFFALDSDGRCILQNSSSRRIWGDVIGKRPRDVVDDADTLALWEGNNRRAVAGETVRGDVEFAVGENTRCIHNIITPVHYEDRVIGIQGINIDITESKQKEWALRESEANLRAISNAVGMVLHIMILDEELRVLDQNEKMAGMFGRCLGKKCHQVVKGREVACRDCPARKAWQDGGSHRLDENWINPDSGAERCFRVHAVPMFEQDGRFEKVMVVAEDITGLKNSEKARKRALEELEEHRVLAIASDRLRTLGEMTAGIAHELNQPLVGVRGLAEHAALALERQWKMSKEDVHEKLQEIVERADRMAYIIEHVRRFAREPEGPEMCPVNLNEVVDSSLGLIPAQLRRCGITTKCELAERVPEVHANPFSLEEVFLNLLTNARDAVEARLQFDPGTDTSVTLRTRVEKQAGVTWVTAEVADRGVGIGAESLARVFNPFYTTKGPDKGTGLGLSISKSIVEKFGGRIEIHSKPGCGTTVMVSLPAIGSAGDASG